MPSPTSSAPRALTWRSTKFSMIAEAKPISLLNRLPMPVAKLVAGVIDLAAYRGLAWTEKEPPINREKLEIMGAPVSFDPSKARALGWAPKVGYQEGIARTL